MSKDQTTNEGGTPQAQLQSGSRPAFKTEQWSEGVELYTCLSCSKDTFDLAEIQAHTARKHGKHAV